MMSNGKRRAVTNNSTARRCLYERANRHTPEPTEFYFLFRAIVIVPFFASPTV